MRTPKLICCRWLIPLDRNPSCTIFLVFPFCNVFFAFWSEVPFKICFYCLVFRFNSNKSGFIQNYRLFADTLLSHNRGVPAAVVGEGAMRICGGSLSQCIISFPLKPRRCAHILNIPFLLILFSYYFACWNAVDVQKGRTPWPLNFSLLLLIHVSSQYYFLFFPCVSLLFGLRVHDNTRQQ